MPKINCAALECVHNHDCVCSLRSIMLYVCGENHLRCSDYGQDEEYNRLMTVLGRNPQLSADREEVGE